MFDTSHTLSPAEFARLDVFRSVRLVDVEPILAGCPLLRVEQGQVVIHAGDVLDRMYVLVRGTVSVRLDDPGSEPIATLERGQVFGEVAAIDGEPASAFVVAESRCRLLSVNREALWEMFALSPQLASNLLSILTRRLRHSNRIIRDLQRRLAAAGA